MLISDNSRVRKNYFLNDFPSSIEMANFLGELTIENDYCHVCFFLVYLGKITVILQWLEQLWYYENMFETGVVRANEANHSTRSGGIIGIFFSIFFNRKVCCVFSVE